MAYAYNYSEEIYCQSMRLLAREAANGAAICTLVQGMPLAIELAAGWVRTHSCAEILREIERNLDFLCVLGRS